MRLLVIAFLFCLVSATLITASCPQGGKIVPSGCTPCAAGDTSYIIPFSSPATLSSCVRCASGTMSVSGGAPAVPVPPTAPGVTPNPPTCASTCASGTYRLDATSSVCQPCEAGTYNAVASSTITACNVCPAGRYCPSTPCTTTYTWATVCMNGNAIGTINPITCPTGMASAAGASQCSNSCPAGTYRQSTSICSPCKAGTYESGVTTAIVGTAGCPSVCAPGYISQAGATECTACPAGSEPMAPSKGRCRECNIGTFSSSPASPTCQQCPVDTYADATGALSCTPCPEGTSTAGATGASTCA